ncbi:MAG: hypothetical protein IKT40_03995, partial [Bacilli bacterium]|nr:hypothetical protein [Bacilli bacterium]
MIIKAQDNNIKHIINEEIASLIKSKKILKKDVLTETLNQAANDGVRYDQYLINNGYLTEEIAASLIANYLDFEYTNIDVIKYSDEIVSQLSLEFIENNKFIALVYDTKKEQYTIALADPFDSESVRKVYALFGVNARIIISLLSKIKKIASRVHSKLTQGEAVTAYDKEISNSGDLSSINDDSMEGADLYDSPAVKLVES